MSCTFCGEGLIRSGHLMLSFVQVLSLWYFPLVEVDLEDLCELNFMYPVDILIEFNVCRKSRDFP